MRSKDKTLVVTLLYFRDDDLRLQSDTVELPVADSGRAIIPADYRAGKQIIGVLEGQCKILNRIGDRILPISSAIMAQNVVQESFS